MSKYEEVGASGDKLAERLAVTERRSLFETTFGKVQSSRELETNNNC